MKVFYSLSLLLLCLALGSFSVANATDRLCYCFQYNSSFTDYYKIVGSYPSADCAECIAERCSTLFGGAKSRTLAVCSYSGVTVVSDIESDIGALESTVIGEIVSETKTVESYVSGLLSQQTATIEAYIDSLLGYLNHTLATFREEVASNFTSIEQEIEDIDVTKVSKELEEAVYEIESNFTGDFKSAISELEAYIKKYSDNIEANITEQISVVEKDIGEINITAVLDSIEKYSEMIEANITEQISVVEKDIEEIDINAVLAYIKKYSEMIEANITEQISVVEKDIGEINITAVLDSIEKYSEMIEANITGQISVVEEDIESLNETILSSIKDISIDSNETVVSIKKDVTEIFKELEKNMSMEFYDIIKDVNISLEDLDDEILTTIKVIAKEVKELSEKNVTVKVDDVLKEMLNINLNISLEQPTPSRKPVCGYQQPPCPYGPSCPMYQQVGW